MKAIGSAIVKIVATRLRPSGLFTEVTLNFITAGGLRFREVICDSMENSWNDIQRHFSYVIPRRLQP
jgi:hypothetical protein